MKTYDVTYKKKLFVPALTHILLHLEHYSAPGRDIISCSLAIISSDGSDTFCDNGRARNRYQAARPARNSAAIENFYIASPAGKTIEGLH